MGTIPTRAAFVPGAVLTATQLNELNAVDAFWARTPRCSAWPTTALSVPNNAYTVVPFDAEVYDDVQAGDTPSHDLTTNNSRLVFRTAGKYEIAGQGQLFSNATGYRAAQVRLNAAGNPAAGTLVTVNQTGAVSGVGTSVGLTPVEIAVTVGDYIELFLIQTSGGALNTIPGSGVTFLRMKLTAS